MNFEMPTLSTLHTLLDPIDCRQEQQRHLSSVLPALSAALGVPIPTPVHPHPQQLAQSLHIPSCERAVVVFIDGLGFWNLSLRVGHTPNMRSMLRQQYNDQPIWTTQPSTTSVAIPTFGTGTAPGFTGMFGYTQRNPRTGNKAQMITFTDDAANQMEEKIKQHFNNYYLLTGNSDCLAFINMIEGMQISTIHSYAKKIITALGMEFGYGEELSVTSGDYKLIKKRIENTDLWPF